MNSPQQTAYNNDDEISLVDLAVLLVKRWKLLLVMLAASAGLGVGRNARDHGRLSWPLYLSRLLQP